MANEKNRDPLGWIIFVVLVVVGLACLIDPSIFKNFGKTPTPAPKAEPAKRLQGFGPQCNLDDELVSCVYRPVIRQEAK